MRTTTKTIRKRRASNPRSKAVILRKSLTIFDADTLVRCCEVRKRNLFECMRQAYNFMHDREWIIDPAGGGGNEYLALMKLEKSFGDIGIPFHQLFDLFDVIPDEDTWRANNYNLSLMLKEWKVRTKLLSRPRAVR